MSIRSRTLQTSKGFNLSNIIPVLNSNPNPFLFIALPVINETEYLPGILECLLHQNYPDFRVYICVNQPDEWWDLVDKKEICEANIAALEMIKRFDGLDIVLIDRCSRGKGWFGKKHGVGWARKTLMDEINRAANETDILVSLDADTTFSENYLTSIARNFSEHRDAVAIAVPYFHKLTGNTMVDRAMLRYEIYMRYYSLNLWRIGSPFSFTALGSAMAFPIWAYRAVGGMTPKMSGEDFYFLQKLRKFGKMIFTNSEKVYPGTRFSDRVYFGTGPAMIKGHQGDWSSYPIYSYSYFDEIRETSELYHAFLKETTSTTVVDFLREQFKDEDPFQLLRENFKDTTAFVRACHEKVDGLRILQYLKFRQNLDLKTNEEHLVEFLLHFYPEEMGKLIPAAETFTFAGSSILALEAIRSFLVKKEEAYQAISIPSLPGQQLPGV